MQIASVCVFVYSLLTSVWPNIRKISWKVIIFQPFFSASLNLSPCPATPMLWKVILASRLWSFIFILQMSCTDRSPDQMAEYIWDQMFTDTSAIDFPLDTIEPEVYINRLYHGWRQYIPGIVTRDPVLSRDPKGRGIIRVEGDYTWDVLPTPIL